MSETPAGWYPDQSMPGTQRYWDGRTWTGHVAPITGPAAPRPLAGGMGVGGGVLLAVLIPIVGIVLGGIELARGNGSRGALLIGVSVVAIVVWTSLLTAIGY